MPEEGLITPELHDFLLKCLCKDPYRRTPAEALLSHPFIAKVETSTLLPFISSQNVRAIQDLSVHSWVPASD